MDNLFIPQLIVGLGNPESKYDKTRHNIGFEAIDLLAQSWQCSWQKNRRFQGLFAEGVSPNRKKIRLLKPLTYMNRSGSAVRHHMKKLGLSPRDVLVLYDDLNLEPGVIRIRQKGSSGGHNGMQDIIDVLGTDEVPRIRIGIGNGFGRGRQADYVLSPFLDSELESIGQAIQRAEDASLLFIREGIVAAMNRFNKKNSPSK